MAYTMIMDLLNQKALNTFGNKRGGLLNPQFTADLGMGLLQGSGYTTMPTSFGQTVGNAYQKAIDSQRKRDLLGIAELGALAKVATATKPKAKTDFFNKLDLFNNISSKPEDQRSQSEQNTLAALEKSLMAKETIGDIKVSIANKLKNGEPLSAGDKAVMDFIKATDPLTAFFGSFDKDSKVDEPESDSEYKKISNINEVTLDDLDEGGKYEINGKKYSFSDGLFTEE